MSSSRNITRTIRCFYLGNIKYSKALALQECLVRWNIHECKNARPTLLLLQHFPVYTVGLRSSVYSQSEESYLSSLGADFVRTNRGGLITFHGPGQLVAYPILNIKSMGLGIRKYVEKLEETIMQICSQHKIEALRSPHTGVWVGNNKICAMGINVQRGITSHGLALNCDTDLDWFNHIVACGIHGKGVTSLSECVGRKITVKQTLPAFLEHFATTFGVKISEMTTIEDNLATEDLLDLVTGINGKDIIEQNSAS